MLSNNDDWPTMVYNIRKSWKTCIRVSHIMGWEGVDANEIFLKCSSTVYPTLWIRDAGCGYPTSMGDGELP